MRRARQARHRPLQPDGAPAPGRAATCRDGSPQRGVEIVCSLPHYRKRNTDPQRGDGTFEKSIEALRRLNAVGYGKGDPRLRLTLVHNPAGAFLAGDQASMEREWKEGLAAQPRRDASTR